MAYESSEGLVSIVGMDFPRVLGWKLKFLRQSMIVAMLAEGEELDR